VNGTRSHPAVRGVIVLVVVLSAARASAQSPALVPPPTRITFTRDIAPILQRSCQHCHRPDSMAPMSLLTYDEVRPWARAIKQKVVSREMPPWLIDRTVGVSAFKDDPSLSDAEIATIAAWVDAGAARGGTAPPKRTVLSENDRDDWHLGRPDLIVELPVEHVIAAGQPDWTGKYEVTTGLTEDRYIRAVEIKPSRRARGVVHHALAHLVQEGDDGDEEESFLSGYAVGKTGDIFPDGAGRLMKTGARILFLMHYHGAKQDVRDRTRIGLTFYPNGYVPRFVQHSAMVGGASDLDIPPGAKDVRFDAYSKLPRAARLTGFQPHMHNRGKAMCLEAIVPPDMDILPISCARFSFSWQLVYNYADEAAPLLPAGTLLHIIGWHDNSAANRSNPDPRNWVGEGGRTIDEMNFAWVNYYSLTDDQYRTNSRRGPPSRAPVRIALRGARDNHEERALEPFGRHWSRPPGAFRGRRRHPRSGFAFDRPERRAGLRRLGAEPGWHVRDALRVFQP
jgi:hypothetical protein